MVFSSLPAYLDPSNWQQQQNHQAGISGGSPQFLPPLSQQTASSLLLPPPQTTDGGGSNSGSPGSIRPGSMSDRARMANIPMPEVALKCPRCESTNTKFCYFNNYSLSQPRHFCKTCRRYWTRGGALRSVPVGGGCRRNKRNKGSSSKSPVSGERQTSSGSTTSAVNSSGTTSTGTPSLLGLSPQIPPLRFMPPLSQFADYLSGHDIGLNYGGIPATSDMNFHLGNLPSLGGGGGSGGVGGVSYLSATGGGVNDQWRLHPGQISSFAGMDLSSGFYPFHHQQQGGGLDLSGGYNGGPGGGSDGSNVRPKLSSSSSSLGLTQAAGSVKTEGSGNNQELNLLSRQLMGIQGNDQQYWNNNGNNNNNNSSPWATDLSGFSSSSTTNQLRLDD